MEKISPRDLQKKLNNLTLHGSYCKLYADKLMSVQVGSPEYANIGKELNDVSKELIDDLIEVRNYFDFNQ